MILGLNELKKSKLSRKALLVVSDGGENNSRYNRRELEEIVEESDALIYAIGFRSGQANFPLLEWMAELSGGLAIPVQAESMPDIAAKVALELRNCYVLGFSVAGTPRDGKVHSLRVQLITPHGMPPLKTSWRRSYRSNLEPLSSRLNFQQARWLSYRLIPKLAHLILMAVLSV